MFILFKIAYMVLNLKETLEKAYKFTRAKSLLIHTVQCNLVSVPSSKLTCTSNSFDLKSSKRSCSMFGTAAADAVPNPNPKPRMRTTMAAAAHTTPTSRREYTKLSSLIRRLIFFYVCHVNLNWNGTFLHGKSNYQYTAATAMYDMVRTPYTSTVLTQVPTCTVYTYLCMCILWLTCWHIFSKHINKGLMKIYSHMYST